MNPCLFMGHLLCENLDDTDHPSSTRVSPSHRPRTRPYQGPSPGTYPRDGRMRGHLDCRWSLVTKKMRLRRTSSQSP